MLSFKVPDRSPRSAILDGSPDILEKDSDLSQPPNRAVRLNHYDNGIFASVEYSLTADVRHTVIPSEEEEFVPPERYSGQNSEPESSQHQVFQSDSIVRLAADAQRWHPLTMLDDTASRWYQDIDHLLDGRKQPLIPGIPVRSYSTSLFHPETTNFHFPLPSMNELEPVTDPQDARYCPMSIVLTGRGSTARCKEKLQLKRWVYETRNANLTFAEKMEKSNWENERLEKL
jgi:hypothetical protein